MREIRPSGSGGGARDNPLLLPYPQRGIRTIPAKFALIPFQGVP